MAQAEVQRGEASHGQAHDMRALDGQMIEHVQNVARRDGLRIVLEIVGHVGRRIAARTEDDAAVAAAEMPHLGFPAARVAAKLMDEDDRRALAGLFMEEPDAVLRSQIGHGIPQY